MLHIEQIKDRLETEERVLIASNATLKTCDSSAFTHELREAGLDYEWASGELYAKKKADPYDALSEAAKACLCSNAFNSWEAIKHLTHKQCEDLLYYGFEHAVRHNIGATSFAGVIGSKLVEELREYEKARKARGE